MLLNGQEPSSTAVSNPLQYKTSHHKCPCSAEIHHAHIWSCGGPDHWRTWSFFRIAIYFDCILSLCVCDHIDKLGWSLNVVNVSSEGISVLLSIITCMPNYNQQMLYCFPKDHLYMTTLPLFLSFTGPWQFTCLTIILPYVVNLKRCHGVLVLKGWLCL